MGGYFLGAIVQGAIVLDPLLNILHLFFLCHSKFLPKGHRYTYVLYCVNITEIFLYTIYILLTLVYMVYRPCDLYESNSSYIWYIGCVTSMKAIQAIYGI
jgi:hypothetical protein